MPRFYFDMVLNGRELSDDEGLELTSPAVAREEAMTAIAEMAKDEKACPKSIVIVIRDESPQPVGTVRLLLTYDGN
jgi:hypothetical protein